MANVTPDTQDEQDRAYSPEEIRQREQAALLDQPSGDETNVADAEENPNQTQEFANNYTGKHNQNKSKSFLSGKGPILAIGGGVGLGGLGLLILLVPGILLFHILANAFDTLDPSSTALSQVAKLMLLSKLGATNKTFTQGSCGPVLTIACKFKTPSNDLLRQLKNEGITALNESGKEIPLDGDGKWPSERPAQYRISSFHTESGETITVKANELGNALEDNATLKRGIDKILKRLDSRAFSRFSPSFLKVMNKFDFGLRDKLNIKERVKTKTKTLVTDLLEKALKSTVGEGATDAAKAIIDSISIRISKALSQLAKASKGSGVVLAMAIQCMANQVPSMLKKALAATQEASAVNMAAPMVTAISAIKVGDGDPETASELGTMFTEEDKNGKSMLDSAGMHYTLYGDKNTSSDPTFKTVTPDAYGDLNNVLTVSDMVFNNPLSYTFCAALMNPVGGALIAAGINAAYTGATSIETFGLSVVLNVVLGAGASLAINSFGDGLGELLGAMIGPGVGELAKPVVNQMAQPGQTRGNVFAYGVGALAANNGSNTFGNYLTTDELSAYTQDMQEQRLAEAEFDRATLSPFDATSRYTFLGSMVSQLTPYYSSLSSVSGGLAVLGSSLPISIGSLFNLSTAKAADASIYQDACYDPESLKTIGDNEGKTLAANIFCQPVAATLVPDNWDPNETLVQMQGMQAYGQSAIDNETGAPTKPNAFEQTGSDLYDSTLGTFDPNATISYYDWLDTCANPENAAGCTAGNNATLQTYSLYTAARNVNAMLDNDPDEAQEVAGEDPETTPPPTVEPPQEDTSNETSAPTDTSDTTTPPEETDSTDTTTDTQPTGAVFPANANLVGVITGFVSPLKNSLKSLFTIRQTNQLAALSTLERFTLWR